MNLCDELTVDINFITRIYSTNNPPRVIRSENDMFCNIRMSARKALLAVGVPEYEVTYKKVRVVRNTLKK